eukprot:3649501-Prymnesium_polylepis.1
MVTRRPAPGRAEPATGSSATSRPSLQSAWHCNPWTSNAPREGAEAWPPRAAAPPRGCPTAPP